MEAYILGSGFAIGLAGLGVGIGEGMVAKKSLSAMGKNPSLMGTFLIFTILGIALVESAAIYSLIVAFNILGIDPAASVETLDVSRVVGAGMAIGFAGLGAGIGEGFLVGGAMEAMLINPDMKGKVMTYMVLYVALVEAIAIYGLIIAMQLLG